MVFAKMVAREYRGSFCGNCIGDFLPLCLGQEAGRLLVAVENAWKGNHATINSISSKTVVP